VFHSIRRYQLWQYSVSHGQLLLRSPKDATHGTRVDVLFSGVRSLNLPTLIDGLSIEESKEPAAVRDVGNLGAWSTGGERASLNGYKLYRLKGPDCDGHIVAASVTHLEDEGEYHEPTRLVQGPGSGLRAF
jgi:hypothetical protein